MTATLSARLPELPLACYPVVGERLRVEWRGVKRDSINCHWYCRVLCGVFRFKLDISQEVVLKDLVPDFEVFDQFSAVDSIMDAIRWQPVALSVVLHAGPQLREVGRLCLRGARCLQPFHDLLDGLDAVGGKSAITAS